MNQHQKSWNIPLIREIFDHDSATRILSTHIPTENLQDGYRWSASTSGLLKVKEVYAHYLLLKGQLNASQDGRKFWNKLWASDLRPKWKFFIWRVLTNAIATNSNLIKRNIPVQGRCYLCKSHQEDTSHLFRDCELTKRVWACSSLGIQTQSTNYIPIDDWIKNFLMLFWKRDEVKSERVRDFILTL